MKRALIGTVQKFAGKGLFGHSGAADYLSNITGSLTGISGNLTGVSGDLTKVTGKVSRKLSGDMTGVFGNLTGITGNVDECKLTAKDRKRGVNISELIKQ